MHKQVYISALAVAAVFGTAASIPAQVCAGLPAESVGSASFGVEGTDGASGERFALAARFGRTGLRIAYSRLDAFARSEDVPTWRGAFTWAPRRTATWGCLRAGAEWTSHSADIHRSTSWDADFPDERTEHHLIVGDYRRARFPVGVSVGRELGPEGDFSAVPFASASLILERQTLSPPNGPDESRTRLAPGLEGGMALRFHRLIVRSTLGHVFSGEDPLTGRNNFPMASLSLGLVF